MEGSASTNTKKSTHKTGAQDQDILAQITVTAGSMDSVENTDTHSPVNLSDKLIGELTDSNSRTPCANGYCNSTDADCGVLFAPSTWICCRCVVVGVLLLEERQKILDAPRESKKRKRTEESDDESARSESPRKVRKLSETERAVAE